MPTNIPSLLLALAAGLQDRGHTGHATIWLPADLGRSNWLKEPYGIRAKEHELLCGYPDYCKSPRALHWIPAKLLARVTCAACLVATDQLFSSDALVVGHPLLLGKEHHLVFMNYLDTQRDYRGFTNKFRDPQLTAAYGLAGAALDSLKMTPYDQWITPGPTTLRFPGIDGAVQSGRRYPEETRHEPGGRDCPSP